MGCPSGARSGLLCPVPPAHADHTVLAALCPLHHAAPTAPHRSAPTALHPPHGTAPPRQRWQGRAGSLRGARCAACPHLLVPTRGFCGMSMVLSTESCFTASPRSAMAQLSFLFTRMFLDFRSLCAIAGLPAHRKELLSVLMIAVQILV